MIVEMMFRASPASYPFRTAGFQKKPVRRDPAGHHLAG